ncbi:DUF1345 domain-containing protein [Modestobacter sp. Leaf380]|uniref:DUF1345 domain-containing protein n=1 Tax=Modestobacter sp. Leaf380 TaxID=1736356 RepID=UPI000B20DBE3|nr:DUF1345 domain-containing protein [Modestobacter sp. Leaf380]
MSAGGRGASGWSAPCQSILSRRRVLICLAGGVLVGMGVALVGAADVAVLAGWTVAAAALLVWVWRISWRRNPEQTRLLAEEEGRTHATDTAVLGAAVVSLGAVVETLVRSRSMDPVGMVAVVLGLLVVILSWALVNTVFALKYARWFYAAGRDGGIDSGQPDPPALSDFVYLAFTVGMSSAVSDTRLVATRVRKLTLGHALLSHLFGTVVVAVAVNLVTNLGQPGQ